MSSGQHSDSGKVRELPRRSSSPTTRPHDVSRAVPTGIDGRPQPQEPAEHQARLVAQQVLSDIGDINRSLSNIRMQDRRRGADWTIPPSTNPDLQQLQSSVDTGGPSTSQLYGEDIPLDEIQKKIEKAHENIKATHDRIGELVDNLTEPENVEANIPTTSISEREAVNRGAVNARELRRLSESFDLESAEQRNNYDIEDLEKLIDEALKESS